jgi:hypothetical protein
MVIRITEAPCLNCRHLQGFPYCKAFPDGIPKEIQLGENQHDRPYPGDSGIQFEPFPETPKSDRTPQRSGILNKLKQAIHRKQSKS